MIASRDETKGEKMACDKEGEQTQDMDVDSSGVVACLSPRILG
jgi:hypothetical protein